jgi:hypothetical protein
VLHVNDIYGLAWYIVTFKQSPIHQWLRNSLGSGTVRNNPYVLIIVGKIVHVHHNHATDSSSITPHKGNLFVNLQLYDTITAFQ